MLKCLLGTLLIVFMSITAIAQTEKPNILWIVSEDNNADMIGCYGN